MPFIYPETFFKFTQMYTDEKNAQKLLINFVDEIIQNRRNEDMNNNVTEGNLLIDQILTNEDKFTKKEIYDHVLTLLSGYETFSISLSHIILLLAMHPEIQEKLYDELSTNLNEDYDIFDKEMMKKCEYLEMVYKESNRLLPPVPIVLRETLEDFEISPGVIIPEGKLFFF